MKSFMFSSFMFINLSSPFDIIFSGHLIVSSKLIGDNHFQDLWKVIGKERVKESLRD